MPWPTVDTRRNKALLHALALQTGDRAGAVLTVVAFQRGLLLKIIETLGPERLASIEGADHRQAGLVRTLKHELRLHGILQPLLAIMQATDDELCIHVASQLPRIVRFAKLDQQDLFQRNIGAIENLIRSGRAEMFVS